MKSAKVLKILHITRQTLVQYVKRKEIRVIPLPNGTYDYNDDDVYRKAGTVDNAIIRIGARLKNYTRHGMGGIDLGEPKVVGDSGLVRIVGSGHSLCPIRHRSPFSRITGSIQKVE